MRPAGSAQIADEGADDAALIDPMVIEKTAILGGDRRLLQIIGNFGQGHPDAPIAGLEDFRETLAGTVEHGAHAGQLSVLECRRIGQVGGRVVVKFYHLGKVDARLIDGLVLAETMIRRIQIRKIDAMEGLGVGAESRRVIEGGRNQIVKIDRFDVEGPAHVIAASAQNLHNPILVSRWIEPSSN